MICRDKLGNEITVGAYIVYGHALGRCAGLQIGKVLSIKAGPTDAGYWRNEHEPPPPSWRIRVVSVDDNGFYGNTRKPTLNNKGTLQFPNRILVLADLPEAYKQILDGAS